MLFLLFFLLGVQLSSPVGVGPEIVCVCVRVCVCVVGLPKAPRSCSLCYFAGPNSL